MNMIKTNLVNTTVMRPLLHRTICTNYNKNNNNYDNVHGAVIMTKVIARVHPVHVMNAD